MCLLALVGCLRPTTDFETLSTVPKWVFEFVKVRISSVNRDEYVHTWNMYTVEVFTLSLRVRGRPQAAFLKDPVHAQSTI